jgi:hypothetical protein
LQVAFFATAASPGLKGFVNVFDRTSLGSIQGKKELQHRCSIPNA